MADVATGNERSQAEGNDRGRWPVKPLVAAWTVPLVGIALAAAVVGPAVRGGRLFLLDWVIGPHSGLPRTVWGLEGGITPGLPFTALVLGLNSVIGAPATWLPFFLFFPIAALGMARLVGGSPFRQVSAVLCYCVNPMVFERAFVGHFAFLIGYALLPFFVHAFVAAYQAPRVSRLTPAVLATVLIGAAPHYAWVVAVLVGAAVFTFPIERRRVVWLAIFVASIVVTSAYLVLASFGVSESFAVGAADLTAYRTRGAPHVGLFVNVAGLYGFWRGGPVLPKDFVQGWPLILLAMLLVVGQGFWEGRKDESRRRVSRLLVIAGLGGFFLSLGDQGPTGAVFRLLFDSVPLFTVMREPQKFAVLLALAYAVFFGWGAAALRDRAATERSRRVSTALCLLPLLYTPTLFGGLGGQVRTSYVPPSWSAANEVMGPGTGRVLFLPWHQYLSFPFTRQVIAAPADAFLRREAIAGDNVELGALRTTSLSERSAYLEFLFANGAELCAFGALVAPLDVQFVLLAKTVDHRSYEWLSRQHDLRLVLDRAEMAVYENLRWTGGASVDDPPTVEDWGELAGTANRGLLNGPARVARPFVAGSIPPGCAESTALSPTPANVPASRLSPVRYRVAGMERQVGTLNIPEEFETSWRLGGQQPARVMPGVIGFETATTGSEVLFVHWRVVQGGYALSLAAMVLLGVLAGRDWRRRRSSVVSDAS